MPIRNLPAAVAARFALAGPALAQSTDALPPPVTISGSVPVASDYRFRGVSQTDRELTMQGGVTVAHDSGVYVRVWGSNLAGWGTFGGANAELDSGAVWYMYPSGADETDCVEPFAKLTGTAGRRR